MSPYRYINYIIKFFIILILSSPSFAKDKSSLEISNTLSIEFPEPSGITSIPQTGLFYLVGDEGFLGCMTADGILEKVVYLGDVDLEGISYDKDFDFLVAIAERRNLLLIIDPEKMQILQTIPVPAPEDGSYEGVTVLQSGSVALVNQTKKKKELSGILILKDLYNSRGGQTGTVEENFIPTGILDQSDIYYEADRDIFYILSDRKDTLYFFTTDGEELERYAIPGINQEGITTGPHGVFYIAQDSGGILILNAPQL